MSTLFADVRKSIPEDWKLQRIDEVATVSSGTTPARRQQARYFDGGSIPWIKTGDLNNGNVSITDEQITLVAVKECSVQLYPPKTVLVAMYGGFKQIGRTGQLEEESAINQALSALQIKNGDVDCDYLQDWLNARVHLWRRFAASSRKDPNITGSDVAAFPIAYPVLPEQRKIAEILSTWDRAIELTEKLIAAKQKRKQALMQQLLTGKVRFPDSDGEWQQLKAGELFESISIKKHPDEPVLSVTQDRGVVCRDDMDRKSTWICLQRAATSWLNRGNS